MEGDGGEGGREGGEPSDGLGDGRWRARRGPASFRRRRAAADTARIPAAGLRFDGNHERHPPPPNGWDSPESSLRRLRHG